MSWSRASRFRMPKSGASGASRRPAEAMAGTGTPESGRGPDGTLAPEVRCAMATQEAGHQL